MCSALSASFSAMRLSALAAGRNRPSTPRDQVDRSDRGVGRAGGPGTGDGGLDQHQADGEVDDVVQAVDLEQNQVRPGVTREGVLTGDREPQQPHHDEHATDDTADDRVDPTRGLRPEGRTSCCDHRGPSIWNAGTRGIFARSSEQVGARFGRLAATASRVR
jgi:hypothetical protein